MYQNAAVLAAFLLLYSAVGGRVERSWISGPIVFTGVGLIFGPDGLGVLRLDIGGEGLRTLAEATLAMVCSPTPRTPILPSSGATWVSLSDCCLSACH